MLDAIAAARAANKSFVVGTIAVGGNAKVAGAMIKKIIKADKKNGDPLPVRGCGAALVAMRHGSNPNNNLCLCLSTSSLPSAAMALALPYWLSPACPRL